MGHLLKVVLSVVLFASAGGGAVMAAGPEAAPSPRLRLVWIDVLGSAPFAFLNASREASAILARAGVEAAWTVGEAASVTRDDELKVVLLDGAAKGARLPEHVMGGTRGGAQSRTTWVYFANVLWALGLQDRFRNGFTPAEEADIARALGRVVAHEIVHAVAPAVPHSRGGLMAGTMGRDRLLQGDVSLAPAEQRAFRAGLQAFAVPAENSSFPVATLYFSPSMRYSSDSDRLKP